MVKLTLDNSVCRIEDLDIKQHKALGQLLSYKVPGQFNRFFWRSLLTKRGEFPSGLLYRVRQFLVANRIHAKVEDLRIRPKSLKDQFKLRLSLTPYQEQLDAAEACLRGRGTICMPTGCGKSVTMALLVNKLQVRTLIVVPNLELKKQLSSSFKAWFGETSNIVIENIDSKRLQTLTNFDCLIIDEAHHVAAATYRKLNKKAWKNIYYRFFFTATPFRSKDEEQLLFESIAGKVIYRVSYKTAVEKGYIVPVEAYYYELPKKEVDGVIWAQVYKELVVDREDRNKLIAKLMSMLENAPTLCLVKEIKHGNILSEYTGVAFANGMAEDTRIHILEFSLNERKSLIGTTGVLGEGVDTKPAEYIIIAGLGKSKNQFMQQIGRGFRTWAGKDSCKAILFYDKSHKWTRAHFRAQCKILLDEYGIKPVKLELPGGL